MLTDTVPSTEYLTSQLLRQYKSVVTPNATLIVTKSLLAGCVFLHLLGLLLPETTTPYVALIPFNVFNSYYLWTLLTAAMYDTRLAATGMTVILFPLLSSYTERTHGSAYTLKLILITAIVSNLTVLISMITMFASTELESYIYSARYGTSAILVSLLICLRHDKSDTALIPNIDTVKYRHLPPGIALLSLFIYITTGMFATECISILSGIYISWLYLRFYAYDPVTTYTGDLTNEFSFSVLFPNVPQIRVVVDVIAATIYHAFKSCGVFSSAIKSQQQREQALLNGDSKSSKSTLNGSTLSNSVNSDVFNFREVDKVAEARRVAAIKRIDDKLAELAKSKTESTDDFAIDIDHDSTPLVTQTAAIDHTDDTELNEKHQ